jgi:hypothetical protein
MIKLSESERCDPAVARGVLDSILSGESLLAIRNFERFLESSVRYLSQSYPDRWGVTLFQDGVRLNVGWVECLVLHSRGLRILLETESAPAGTKFYGGRYKKAPGCAMTNLTPSELRGAWRLFAESHCAALSIAAKHKPPRSIREANSTGLISMLGLPNPEYAVTQTTIPRRYWTAYWRQQYWEGNPEYQPVTFSGSDLFRKRGVSAGDFLYIISQNSGQLLLGGRMVVGNIVSRSQAVRIRKRNDLYEAEQWAVGKEGSGTPLHHHRQLAPTLARELRFVSNQSEEGEPLVFVNGRDLDRQTTRGIRQLTSRSASLLDDIIEMTEELARTPGTTIITQEHLRLYRGNRDLAAAFHEEISDGVAFAEGSLKRVLVNRYERDPNAREACIRHYGVTCSACGFDFGVFYGEVATGFTHVHHLIPLSRLGAEYVLNPIEDLRPVCPNCHAMLHRRTPPYSIEDLRGIIDSRRSGS